MEGSLTIPEVSHEIVCDNLSHFTVSYIIVLHEFLDDCLQYNWTLSTEASSEVNAIFALAKSRLPTAIETKLATFPSAIIDAHGRDLTISTDASRTGTPAPASTPPSGPAVAATSQTAASASVKRKADTVKVNSATVVVEAEFHAAADDLFSLLTDEKRIPIWTRAPAQVCRFFCSRGIHG